MRKQPSYRSIILQVFLTGLLLLFAGLATQAQTPVKVYKVKGGKMYIELSRNLSLASLDSFISQFQLESLALKEFVGNGFSDSLVSQGWKIDLFGKDRCVIIKPLLAAAEITDPVERTHLLAKEMFTRTNFPSVSDGVKIGYNRFRNKHPFLIGEDSVVVFYLRNQQKASKVMLAGSFNNWSPDALAMQKTDSGWVALVKLSPGKYWYKFIVDGEWRIDSDNVHNENDGMGNTNSVFFVTNHLFRLEGYERSRKVAVAGSFNDWQSGALQLVRAPSGWELPVYLAEGTHTYRFIADKEWFADPANTERFPNEFNEYNSVIRKGQETIFVVKGYRDALSVRLTGTFNNWRTDELFMQKTDSGWVLPYVTGPGNHEYAFRVDNQWAADTNGRAGIAAAIVKFNLISQPNYTFRLKGFENANQVFLAGDFNNWNPQSLQMQRDQDGWMFNVYLSPGKHLYKFIIDGQWIIDPGNELWEENEHGSGNSILWKE